MRAWMLSIGVIVAAGSVATAQQAEQAQPERQITEQHLVPSAPPQATDQPGFVEKVRQWADDTKIIERLSGEADGWYPRFGGIRAGSGFAGGPGYRDHILGDVLIDMSAAMSVRGYKAFDTRVRWLQSRRHRAELWTDYGFDDFTQERFFGLGGGTTEDGRTSYGFRNNTIALRAVLRPSSRVAVTARAAYMHPTVYSGNEHEYPHVGDTLTDAQAPGVATQPAYLQTQVSASVDARDTPGNPARGGLYTVAIARWDDRDGGAFDFRRVDATAQQFMPLTADKRHVVVGRIGIAAATPDRGARVPFYYLPYIGGSDTIRSYVEYRFMAENTMWYGGEYRWNVMPYVSLAGFADAGRVARTWSGLGSADTKPGYGFGIICHTSKQLLGRLDVGYGGGEGWQIWFDLGF